MLYEEKKICCPSCSKVVISFVPRNISQRKCRECIFKELSEDVCNKTKKNIELKIAV